MRRFDRVLAFVTLGLLLCGVPLYGGCASSGGAQDPFLIEVQDAAGSLAVAAKAQADYEREKGNTSKAATWDKVASISRAVDLGINDPSVLISELAALATSDKTQPIVAFAVEYVSRKIQRWQQTHPAPVTTPPTTH